MSEPREIFLRGFFIVTINNLIKSKAAFSIIAIEYNPRKIKNNDFK